MPFVVMHVLTSAPGVLYRTICVALTMCNELSVVCFSENTAVVGSPYLVEQEDAKAAVDAVSYTLLCTRGSMTTHLTSWHLLFSF